MCFYSFVKGFGILCLIQQFPEVGKSKILVASFIDKKEKTQNCFLCHASSLSHAWLCDPMDCSLPGSSVHRDSPGRNTRVGCHALLWGIFPNQGSNPGLLHCRWIPYHPSHQGSPRTVEWVGSLSLLQVIIPTQESSQGLLSCRWILYQLSFWPDRWWAEKQGLVLEPTMSIWFTLILFLFFFLNNAFFYSA